ncbi:enoyl-CoA hydratase/isomerase family protein [Rhodococcus artemisiae]|uniref:Enoyl-CoA hydratase/isomerase family protein n=1 Tax=Rhodococcus artemisiae TaxID=714159 RepID=A0ABU7LC53_9NOCA|nr:enoyl-CoA hydratase/isomerase family protein [Rhodococcus artemisiae]MEE2059118.1 enoyl-CoA hydratase/isomerase family protein [Rhodococcus artemisiae]
MTQTQPAERGVSSMVRDDHVAVLEFSRPPNNYFDLELLESLADTCEDLAADGHTRAIVLRSSGRVFCAGADFAASAGDRDPGPLYAQALRLFRQPLPMIAAVQGAAIGGGLGLALSADFRISSREGRFAANFAQIGIHHGFGLSVTLPEVVGRQTAMELLYTGRRIAAADALSVGLIDMLVDDPSQLVAEALAYAARIASSAPLAVRSIRRTLRADLACKLADAVAHECAEQQELFTTEDFREGVRSVAERRTGRFIGR